MVIHTYFCTKGYYYVQRFVRVLVLLVINTGRPKKLLKMGNTALLISSSNYALPLLAGNGFLEPVHMISG